MADVATLQERLEKAKENLQNVDENIRKLTGREPGEIRRLPVGVDRDQRRVSLGTAGPRGRGRGRGGGVLRADTFQRLGVPIARRQSTGSAFSRLGGRVDRPQPKRPRINDDEDQLPKHTIQSSVVATPKVVRTRKESIEEQNKDVQGQKRNRRMFGHLLGTLQKFKQESNDMEVKERKRSEIEKKLEEQAIEEKRAVAAQRSQLFTERRQQQSELQKLQRLVDIAAEQNVWDAHTKELSNFIRTKANPPIFYKPAKPSLVTEKKLKDSKELLNEMMKKRRKEVEEEIREMQADTPKEAEAAGKETEYKKEEETTKGKGKTKDRKKKHSKVKHEDRRNGKAKVEPGSEEENMQAREEESDGDMEGENDAIAIATVAIAVGSQVAEELPADYTGEAGKDGVGMQGTEPKWEAEQEMDQEEVWQDRTGTEDWEAGLPKGSTDAGDDQREVVQETNDEAVTEDFRTALYREEDQKPELSWEEDPMEQ